MLTASLAAERLFNRKISHAYVFAGEAGAGKFELARAFAKALECEANSSKDASDASNNVEGVGKACGVCLSCKVFESGNHPDVFYVKATKTKAIGVGDIREQIVLPMSEKPFRYRYKIFIVNDVMTPQAQNALLKTIEEPASFGIFLFLTDNLELILPTVLSRSVTLKISKAGLEMDNLDNLNNLDSFEGMREFAAGAARSILGMDVLTVFDLCDQFDKWKDQVQNLLDMLYVSYSERLAIDIENTARGLGAITEAKRALSQNGNFQMNIETMLLKMR